MSEISVFIKKTSESVCSLSPPLSLSLSLSLSLPLSLMLSLSLVRMQREGSSLEPRKTALP